MFLAAHQTLRSANQKPQCALGIVVSFPSLEQRKVGFSHWLVPISRYTGGLSQGAWAG